MKKALLALALMSASTALFAQGTSSPSTARVTSPTPDNLTSRLSAAEAKSEALEDRLIAVEAKGEAAESAYSRFEVITGLLALFITLLVAAFGFFTHRAAVNAVKAETSDLKEQLRKNIEEAAQNAQSQREEFERQKGEIAALLAGAGEDARQLSVHKDAAAASAAEINAMLAKMQSAPPDARAADLPPDERAQVEAAAKNLEDKPQSEWTLADFKSRIALAALVQKDSAEVLRLAEELARAHVHDSEAVAYSLFQQAFAHNELGKPERAIALYSELDERFGSSEMPALQEQVAKALVNKGWTLGTLGRSDDAIAAYDAVLSRFETSDAPALQEPVARTLVNKSVALATLGRTDDAIAACDVVLARFGTSNAPALQEQVGWALFNTACAHAREQRVKASIAMLEKWAAHCGSVDCQRIAGDADFDAVRDRPSFKGFLRKHGCG